VVSQGDAPRARRRTRRRRALRRAALAGLLLASPGAAAGEPWTLRLDPEATEIRFHVGATLHTVRGRFALEQGAVRFDPETGAVSGEVVVDARSGDTGIDRRDRTMHRELLASEAHPDLVLRPRRLRDVRREGDRLEATLEAELVLRGEAHPLALTIEGRRVGEDRGAVEGRFEVPYVAWGLPDPDTFVLRVDDVVHVVFRASGALAPAR
jgi:polyisoprenoid-binding protein YceI